ncbi:hypothetical protein GGF31_006759 [Allomyces arbusculus]|nr:hypothetical protein GGF31_006759 [Allomyces arbusculus]
MTLTKLHLTAPRIHPQSLSGYLLQYRMTLQNLALHAVIDATTQDMMRAAPGATVGWPELHELEMPTTALFLMVAALPALTKLSLTGFLSKLRNLLNDLATVAPRLHSLQFVECTFIAGSRHVVMSAPKCSINRTTMPSDLTTFIDAPLLDELRVVVDEPMAAFNMQFWSSINH